MRDSRATVLRALFHVVVLFPLLWLLWDLWQGHLTANPIREIQLRTGRYALTFLLLSLACTPLYRLTGLRQVLDLRRPLGLYTFLYASLHFLNFLGVDYAFNLPLIREDLFEKRYAVVGFAAYLLLLSLAVTSTRGWQNRLRGKWRPLHRLVYGAAVLGEVHFLWQARADFRAPIIYGVLLALLLVFRLPWLRQAATRCILSNRDKRKGRV